MGGGQPNKINCKIKCRDGQKKNQNPVFNGLGRTIAVKCYLGGDRFFAVGCKSHELMDGTEGTYPAAEKPAQNDGQDNGGKSPQQAGIQGAGAQQGGQSDQWIQLNDPVYRPAAQLPPLIP